MGEISYEMPLENNLNYKSLCCYHPSPEGGGWMITQRTLVILALRGLRSDGDELSSLLPRFHSNSPLNAVIILMTANPKGDFI